MSFFAVLFALLIEQLRPMPRDSVVVRGLTSWLAWVGRNLDAGKPHHGQLVWAVSVLGPTLLVAGVFWLVSRYSLVGALAVDVLVLYVTLGFRQFSHHFTAIRDALERGDEPQARRLLAEWQHLDASELPRSELLRHVIEDSLLAAHRHVFGVFFWFVLSSAIGLGPAGAVLYRMADFIRRYAARRRSSLQEPINDGLPQRARQAFQWLDHVPARMTAFGFAVVGDFEEAIGSWRRDAGLWKHPNEGVILAAAAGAVGVQLSGGVRAGPVPDAAGVGGLAQAAAGGAADGSISGAPVQMGHLQSMVGLVWRSMILWMLLLALLTLASVLG
jgi:adenosylcobinamide-phosphate synthase